MFDEPNERPPERPTNPADRAREKSDEFRTHAELAAVFEGIRKFDAQILPSLDATIAREIQKAIGKLEKSRVPETPVLLDEAMDDAFALLTMPKTRNLSTNDYHIHRRPGEVMIVRFLEEEQVESFHERLQAHFDAALAQCREEERQSHGWKQDPETVAYIEALDAIDVRMADRYLRDVIRESSKLKEFKGRSACVLSTQAADEMNIAYLCDYIMGVEASEVVGKASAPPEEPSEADLAWFFKLFSLRGITDGVERICLFAYLQKADESAW